MYKYLNKIDFICTSNHKPIQGIAVAISIFRQVQDQSRCSREAQQGSSIHSKYTLQLLRGIPIYVTRT